MLPVFYLFQGDRWGSNPQPLEPQSRAPPIELRSPHSASQHSDSIANYQQLVNS